MEDGSGSVDNNMVLTSQETLPVNAQDEVDVVLDSDGGEKLETDLDRVHIVLNSQETLVMVHDDVHLVMYSAGGEKLEIISNALADNIILEQDVIHEKTVLGEDISDQKIIANVGPANALADNTVLE